MKNHNLSIDSALLRGDYKNLTIFQSYYCISFDIGAVIVSYHVLYLTYHFVYQFYSRTLVLVQSSFHTTWTSLFEMELEQNSLDWNGYELENELEIEDMQRTTIYVTSAQCCFHSNE